MRILPVNSEEYVFKIDLLQTLSYVIVLFLCVFGVFPWWVMLFYIISGMSGMTIKVGGIK